jgi:hypothetical protein
MKKVEICIGDEFTVDFLINRNGGKPICRIDGMIGFIDKSVKDFVTPSSSWVVSVTGIADSFLWVKPLLKVRTPKENQVIFEEKLKNFHKEKTPRSRIQKEYQFKSFAELKAEKEVQS